MPYSGTQADAVLEVARDGIADYYANNSGGLTGAQQNSMMDSLNTIDQQRNAIATMAVLDALDPAGTYFPRLSQATQDAKTTLDNLTQTQQDIAKAFTIAGDVVSVAMSIASMNVLGFGAAVDQLVTDVGGEFVAACPIINGKIHEIIDGGGWLSQGNIVRDSDAPLRASVKDPNIEPAPGRLA